MCTFDYSNDDTWGDRFECSHAEEMEEKLADVQDYFLGMLEMMYAKKEFDRNKFEVYIGEICAYLDIKEPIEPLAIISNGLKKEVVNV